MVPGDDRHAARVIGERATDHELIRGQDELPDPLRRLLGKKSFKKQDILRRIKAQIPLRAKVRLADFIIDNNGSLTETEKQVKGIMGELIPRPAARQVRARDYFPTSIEGKSGGKLWKS